MGLGGHPSLGAAGELVLGIYGLYGSNATQDGGDPELPSVSVCRPPAVAAVQRHGTAFRIERARTRQSDHQDVFPAEMIPISVFLSTLVGHFLGLALMLGAVAVI